jgi:acyl carrier protein
MDEHRARIRGLIGEHADGAVPADTDDIFATGYVNSLFAIQLVLWIERTYGLAINGTDLDIANFRTINDIGRLIDRLTGARPEPATAGRIPDAEPER